MPRRQRRDGRPLGIVNYPRSANNTPTLNQVTTHAAAVTGASGDSFSPSDILVMLGLVEEAPDPLGATSWNMRPMFFAAIANARADAVATADGKGPFLFPITRGDLGAPIGKQMAGIPVGVSTQVSKARIKGSGTALTYVVCGATSPRRRLRAWARWNSRSPIRRRSTATAR